MPITQNDIRLYASERMSDTADGGGSMSGTVIVDGQDNNVFPDLTDIERLTGRVSVRKLFGAVLSSDTDTYLSAHSILDDSPDDAATSAVIFTTGTYTTERAAAIAHLFAQDLAGTAFTNYLSESGTAYLWAETSTPGAPITDTPAAASSSFAVIYETNSGFRAIRWIVATGTAVYPLDSQARPRLTLNAPLPAGASAFNLVQVFMRTQTTVASRVYGVAEVAAAASSGATSVIVDNVFQRVLPLLESSTYPQTSNGNAAPWSTWNLGGLTVVSGAPLTDLELSHGMRQIIKRDDPVVIHDTQSLAPAAVSNGQTVNTGRTTLARLRVIGNNGVEIARFVRGVPFPSGVGCTADLDAGTVTFSNVAGMSQPVTVEHRIEEMALVQSVVTAANGIRLNLNRALSRAYPATARVSSALMLGDLQARVQAGFAQQAWTGVFSDAVIGGTPAADFNEAAYPATTTNRGAITERWAFIFTGPTSFRCIGENIGEIPGGSTGVDYSPINPATGSPYFTIPSAGWGLGWNNGNVYRRNTVGAQAPLWVARTVAPSAPAGNDAVTVEFRGYVNT